MEQTKTAGHEPEREIGVLAFRIGPYRLGVNLFKVREITPLLPIKAAPGSHPLVLGMFALRGRLAPAVNLNAWLNTGNTAAGSAASRMIIAEYLGLRVGFPVDHIDGIHHLGWRDIEPPGRLERYAEDILGVVKINGDLICLIDYEHIIMEINPDMVFAETQAAKGSKKLTQLRSERSVWIIEDSKTVRDFFRTYLTDHGYRNLLFFENGLHAAESLEVLKRGKVRSVNDDEWPDLIISDIEMPIMDGYSFIKSIKRDELLKSIPIILFSSLLTSENKLRGELAEADAQLSKSESGSLIHVMDRFIFR